MSHRFRNFRNTRASDFDEDGLRIGRMTSNQSIWRKFSLEEKLFRLAGRKKLSAIEKRQALRLLTKADEVCRVIVRMKKLDAEYWRFANEQPFTWDALRPEMKGKTILDACESMRRSADRIQRLMPRSRNEIFKRVIPTRSIEGKSRVSKSRKLARRRSVAREVAIVRMDDKIAIPRPRQGQIGRARARPANGNLIDSKPRPQEHSSFNPLKKLLEGLWG